MTVTASTASTNCAACSLPFRDAIDAQTGLDQKCRGVYGYRLISGLPDAERIEANHLIHVIAQDAIRGDRLRTAIFRLYELGFVELSKRIERRVGSATREGGVVEVAMPVAPSVGPPPAEAPPPTTVPPSQSFRPLGFEPTQGQAAALEVIRQAMRVKAHQVVIVVGYAGTGKTSLILFIAHEHGIPVCVAPTGKAALRIREATGIDAMTIHRLIYRAIEDEKTGVTKFVRKTPEEIEAGLPKSRLLVLDEASMVGPDVWRDVIAVSQQHGLRLVCIGDGFQLPPVQAPGAPPFSILLPDFARELGAHRVELTEVLRQAQDSPIIRASMRLRNGEGRSAFQEIQEIQTQQIAGVCLAVQRQAGVTICHRNVTRFRVNTGIRQMLGIHDDLPQPGEPLLCLKNTPEAGVVNGETIQFPGWSLPPEHPEQVSDSKWKPGVKEMTHFGAVKINKSLAVLSVEELHGRLTLSARAISTAAAKWARNEHLYSGDSLAPHIAANFGYAFTAHKSQGSAWPFVFIVLEHTIRLNEEEGRRWAYTSLTRASEKAAVYFGSF